MKYFAYGSNMSIARLRERTPSAAPLGSYALKEHDLRFHKSSEDGSGKCDAFYTGDRSDVIYGVLFEIFADEKPALDRAEGLGHGYDQKNVTVLAVDGSSHESLTYIATKIDGGIRPYSWYVNNVLVGARETLLPENYIKTRISSVESIQDTNRERDAEQRAIYC